jgi:hypothetical protein
MLAATNAGGGGLAATAEATGGRGGTGSVLGESEEATASVVATGDAGVTASSIARGGSGAGFSDPRSSGGDATALASAIGAGTLTANSSATGGSARLNGAAMARSSTTGSSGVADAGAGSGGGRFTSVVGHARAFGPGTMEAEARALVQRELAAPAPDAQEVMAVAVGSPLPVDVQSALSGNPNAIASLPAAALGMALLGATDPGDASDLQGDITFRFAPSTFSTEDRLVLALLNVSFLGDFDLLTFRILQHGAIVVDRTFTEADEVLDFFDDEVLALGPVLGSGGINSNSLRFDWDLDGAGGGTTFSATALFSIVPEPQTGFLLFQGLLVIAFRARRRRRRARPPRRYYR